MRYIGRIITASKIDGISEFIDVTKDTSSIVDNKAKIPTLIIGYRNAESICGPLKMTEKKIGENLYWTFSKRERRIDYEPDLQKFLSTVSSFLMKFCRYEYVDVLTADEGKIAELKEDILEGNGKKVVYDTENMYYVYSPSRKEVVGISKELVNLSGMCDMTFNNSTFVSESEFSENKISKSRFVMPILYYLKSF